MNNHTSDAEQNLRRLRTTIDALPSPVLIEDQDRRLVCVNQAFCDLFGIEADPDALIGADCAQAAEYAKPLFAEPNAFIAGIDRALKAQKPIKGESLTLKDGRVLERSYTPIFLDSTYQGHFWQYNDVTDLVAKARELEASRDRAWEASRLKSEFLAIMSHEIRTPMNGVICMAELLLTTQMDDAQRDVTTIIYEESQSLLRILNDILDFSRIEAGKVVLDPVPFSIYELFVHIADVTRHQAERKGLSFQTSLQPGLPVLYGDGGRLRQIVINLLNNAIKFTKKGGIYLSVTAQTTPDQQVALQIQVQDTGKGIPPEKVAAMFEPFTQGDTSTTREYGGTGLGLAIVKRLVTLLGGKIEVTSEPGKGSTFTVQLVMEASDGEYEAFATSEKAAAQSTPQSVPADEEKRILVVEDNYANRQLAMEYLHRLGHRNLQFAEDGQEAVELVMAAADKPYSLILMDIQLIRMDGMTATKAIREFERPLGRHTPVVALTAHATMEDHRACLAAGMDDVLIKPLQRTLLAKVLSAYLDAKPA